MQTVLLPQTLSSQLAFPTIHLNITGTEYLISLHTEKLILSTGKLLSTKVKNPHSQDFVKQLRPEHDEEGEGTMSVRLQRDAHPPIKALVSASTRV